MKARQKKKIINQIDILSVFNSNRKVTHVKFTVPQQEITYTVPYFGFALFAFGMIDESLSADLINKGYGYFKKNTQPIQFSDHSVDCVGFYNITYFSFAGSQITLPDGFSNGICMGVISDANPNALQNIGGYIIADGVKYNIVAPIDQANATSSNGTLWCTIAAKSDTGAAFNINNFLGKEIEIYSFVEEMTLSDHYVLNTNGKDELRKILSLHNNDLSNVTLEFTDNVTNLDSYFDVDYSEVQTKYVKLPKKIIGKNITSMRNAFSHVNVTEVYETTLSGLPNLKDCHGIFSAPCKIKTIPENIFSNNKEIVDLSLAFRSCSISEIPANLFKGLSKVETFQACFEFCRITSIPENLFDDCINVEDFSETFGHCKRLVRIGNIFKNNVNVRTFNQCFGQMPIEYESSDLTDISELSFRNNILATDFNYLFNGHDKLKTIPNTLFEGCINMISLNTAFENCKSLESIPDNLLKDCTSLETISRTFQHCYSLASVPFNLFDSSKSLKSVGNCFRDCSKITSSLPDVWNKEKFPNIGVSDGYGYAENCSGALNYTEIPYSFGGMEKPSTFDYYFETIEDFNNRRDQIIAENNNDLSQKTFGFGDSVVSIDYLFSSTNLIDTPKIIFGKNIVSASYCFSNCRSLKIVRENVFNCCIKITDFSHCFENCESLTTLYDDLFSNNTKATNFSHCFENCTSLKSIPTYYLFSRNVNATNFSYCFRKTSINNYLNNEIFINNKNAIDFSYCFENCALLESVSIDLFDNNKNVTNFSFTFSDCVNIQSDLPDVWNKDKFPNVTDGFNYAYNCKKATNYANVPENFGGVNRNHSGGTDGGL